MLFRHGASLAVRTTMVANLKPHTEKHHIMELFGRMLSTGRVTAPMLHLNLCLPPSIAAQSLHGGNSDDAKTAYRNGLTCCRTSTSKPMRWHNTKMAENMLHM